MVTNWTRHYHSDSLKVSMIILYLNTVDFPVFFTLLSTLTWDTSLTLRGTKVIYLDYVAKLRHSQS